MAHQEHSQKFLQKKRGKNIPFLDEKHTSFGRREGVPRALTKKIDPR